jgi:hypothetical protein
MNDDWQSETVLVEMAPGDTTVGSTPNGSAAPESVILFDPDFALGLAYFISPFVKRPREGSRISFVPGLYRKDREVVAPVAGAHGRGGHAQTTPQTSRITSALFTSLISSDRHHEFFRE